MSSRIPARADANAGANHPGIHLLRPAEAARFVRRCDVRRAEFVLDLGCGRGAVTEHLLAAGARVLAVERDPEFVVSLRRRYAGQDHLRVVQADLRGFRLPARPYRVVASIPFATSAALLRRLLGPQGAQCRGADLIVEWGLARRFTASVPRDVTLAWWAAVHELTLRRRVPAERFSPRPRVDAAHLAVRPRPRLRAAERTALWALLGAAYDRPERSLGALLRGTSGRASVRAADVTAATPAGAVTPEQWYRLVARG